MSAKPQIGSIGWIDLTVEDATEVRQFYEQVVGWTHSEVSMGEYSDFAMIPAGGDSPVAGVCHKTGANADQPSQWMVYLVVENLDASIAKCTDLGGRLLVGPKNVGPDARYGVIQDPAGAVVALYEQA